MIIAGSNKDYGADIIDQITVEGLMKHLTEEEQQILQLWLVDEKTFSEIGEIIGTQFRGKALSGSVIRYHRDRILIKLREFITEE